MEWWQIGLAANAVLFVAYMGITTAILRPLAATKQLRTNRLGLATGIIFFSCGVGHLFHGLHLAGLDGAHTVAARASIDWHIALWDLGTASVGIWYWSLRTNYSGLMRGAALFEDMREKQRQALEINDNIVQGLTVAKMALDLDQQAKSKEALETALASARGIISDLLGDETKQVQLGPGDLRRSAPAKAGA